MKVHVQVDILRGWYVWFPQTIGLTNNETEDQSMVGKATTGPPLALPLHQVVYKMLAPFDRICLRKPEKNTSYTHCNILYNKH